MYTSADGLDVHVIKDIGLGTKRTYLPSNRTLFF